jgi:hypothetical protein
MIITFKLPILYCSGIFLRKLYFHFTESPGSAENHLRNTDLIPEILSPGAKRLEDETPDPSANVRNTSGHSSSPACLHGVMFNETQGHYLHSYVLSTSCRQT